MVIRTTLLATERLFWHCGDHTAKSESAQAYRGRFLISKTSFPLWHVDTHPPPVAHLAPRAGRRRTLSFPICVYDMFGVWLERGCSTREAQASATHTRAGEIWGGLWRRRCFVRHFVEIETHGEYAPRAQLEELPLGALNPTPAPIVAVTLPESTARCPGPRVEYASLSLRGQR